MNAMSKNILLPQAVVVDLYKLIIFLDDYELDEPIRSIVKRLEQSINSKIEAMEKRKTYTEYKMAADEKSREAARQKYLDLAGIHRDWRWGADAEQRRRDGEVL
jgi:hypothetical protein